MRPCAAYKKSAAQAKRPPSQAILHRSEGTKDMSRGTSATSVAYLVSELLERHESNRIEVVPVSDGVDDGSEERRESSQRAIRSMILCLRRPVSAALINDLQIDIEIDLGHSANSRLGIHSVSATCPDRRVLEALVLLEALVSNAFKGISFISDEPR